MVSKQSGRQAIVGGVDTHKDTHTVAALDSTGVLVGVDTFAATTDGYTKLLAWLEAFGRIDRIGIEGTGSYGAGLSRFLHEVGIHVVEVIRPSRQTRRRQGKSDPVDAMAAARAALAGDDLGTPKSQDGPVEAIRLLRLQRRSAIKARTQAINQLYGVLATAPEDLRGRLDGLGIARMVEGALRIRIPASPSTPELSTRYVIRGLARRWRNLDNEIKTLDRELERLVRSTAPDLVGRFGIGIDVAGALLVAAGDNPERLRREASFAALCGVSPVDASSGRQRRHRLNRGGNRDANRALWVIAFVRMRADPRTREYVDRRIQQGLSKPEILRCLKRYIAREVFRLLRSRTGTLAISAKMQNVA
jgi:transposase